MQEMVPVQSKCGRCGSVENFEVSRAALDMRSKGVTVDVAFAELGPARIRQLTEHVCPTCQSKEV